MSGLIAGTIKGSMLLSEIRKRYPNYHPVMAIVEIAHHNEASLDLQFNCHKTVAKYIEPELKSIEVKGDLKTVQTVRVSLFGDNDVETVAYQSVPDAEVPAVEVPSGDVDSAVSAYSFGIDNTGF